MFSWSRIEPNARRFTGQHLRTIAFPLGGIGTGTVSLGGRGNLRDWEIFNRPAKGHNLPYTFFCLWARASDGPPVARVLERRILPPYEGASGLPTGLVSGLPRFEEVEFTGAYPAARLRFIDNHVPLTVTLEAFNPMVPMDDELSGLPVAVFLWTLENRQERSVHLTLCFSVLNACGLNGTSVPGNRFHPALGGNLNRFMDRDGVRGFSFETMKYPETAPEYGSMAVATSWDKITFCTRWERAGWWDDIQSFWDDFSRDGLLPDGPDPEPSPEGQTDVASLGLRAMLQPGEQVQLPIVLAWCFPNLTNYWNHEDAVRGRRLGNWYSVKWPKAWDAAQHTVRHLRELGAQTDQFLCALFDSTLPSEVLDAVSANMSTIRTTTCLRTEDGRFHGFEGCGDNSGCCPMNCTHVWNYEQTLAFLYPALERSMRATDFGHNTRPDGNMAFRTLLPLEGHPWQFKPAADGQMGTILKVYREWLQSGDDAFLQSLWPAVERALEYAWSRGGWDADRDGVMEGEQHNTYDIEFHGPNTMMGTLYLGALKAAERMARHLGHEEKAQLYHSVYESGRAKYVELLWNGSYFRQLVLKPGAGLDSTPLHPDDPAYPRYQFGEGCLSDHLLGQWFAHVVDLGDLLPTDNLRSAILSIYKSNFRPTLVEHQSVQRTYALNDEAGLLLCTWPQGGRPAYPFPYADEVWTGIEYEVAAELIYQGFITEGLEIVRAVRSRHDGLKRNPWNEPECGHHYARAMSSWSVLLALIGYHYDASRSYLRVIPRIEGAEVRTLLTAGTGWGTVTQKRHEPVKETTVNCLFGQFKLRQLQVPLSSTDVTIMANGQTVPATIEQGVITFAEPLHLEAGDILNVKG